MESKQKIFGNNGSIDEQVNFQEKIQKIGLNLVCCCTCNAVFFHRTGAEFVDTLICPFCKAESDPSDFSDCYYSGMYEHRMELNNQ